MNKIVLDASVLLAILHAERGAEKFTSQSGLLETATMSAVNVAEAYSKLVGSGIDPDDAWEAVTAPIPEIVAFDTNQAEITGRLIPLTRSAGLSLGDRACLGLGMALKAPVYTADRAWRNLRVGVTVHVIRT
jgi:ribonuclease VapC